MTTLHGSRVLLAIAVVASATIAAPVCVHAADGKTELVRRLFSTAVLSPAALDDVVAETAKSFDRRFFNCVRDLRFRMIQLESATDRMCDRLEQRRARMQCMEDNPLRGVAYLLADIDIVVHGGAGWLQTTSGRAVAELERSRSNRLAEFDESVYVLLANILGTAAADRVRHTIVDSETVALRQYADIVLPLLVCPVSE